VCVCVCVCVVPIEALTSQGVVQSSARRMPPGPAALRAPVSRTQAIPRRPGSPAPSLLGAASVRRAPPLFNPSLGHSKVWSYHTLPPLPSGAGVLRSIAFILHDILRSKVTAGLLLEKYTKLCMVVDEVINEVRAAPSGGSGEPRGLPHSQAPEWAGVGVGEISQGPHLVTDCPRPTSRTAAHVLLLTRCVHHCVWQQGRAVASPTSSPTSCRSAPACLAHPPRLEYARIVRGGRPSAPRLTQACTWLVAHAQGILETTDRDIIRKALKHKVSLGGSHLHHLHLRLAFGAYAIGYG